MRKNVNGTNQYRDRVMNNCLCFLLRLSSLDDSRSHDHRKGEAAIDMPNKWQPKYHKLTSQPVDFGAKKGVPALDRVGDSNQRVVIPTEFHLQNSNSCNPVLRYTALMVHHNP